MLVGDAEQLAPSRPAAACSLNWCRSAWAQNCPKWRMRDPDERCLTGHRRHTSEAWPTPSTGTAINSGCAGDPVTMADDAFTAWTTDHANDADSLLIADRWKSPTPSTNASTVTCSATTPPPWPAPAGTASESATSSSPRRNDPPSTSPAGQPRSGRQGPSAQRATLESHPYRHWGQPIARGPHRGIKPEPSSATTTCANTSTTGMRSPCTPPGRHRGTLPRAAISRYRAPCQRLCGHDPRPGHQHCLPLSTPRWKATTNTHPKPSKVSHPRRGDDEDAAAALLGLLNRDNTAPPSSPPPKTLRRTAVTTGSSPARTTQTALDKLRIVEQLEEEKAWLNTAFTATSPRATHYIGVRQTLDRADGLDEETRAAAQTVVGSRPPVQSVHLHDDQNKPALLSTITRRRVAGEHKVLTSGHRPRPPPSASYSTKATPTHPRRSFVTSTTRP